MAHHNKAHQKNPHDLKLQLLLACLLIIHNIDSIVLLEVFSVPMG